MTAPGTTLVEVGGSPVRARVSGPADGEPLLLVHGIGRSLEDWQAAHDRLAVTHRAVSIDLPGFGLTRRGGERAGLASFARAVVGVLDALGEQRPVHLMGNSLGGAVAMTTSVDFPDRVASLTLVNSAGFGRTAHVSVLPMLYGALSAAPVVGPWFRPLARNAGIQVNRRLFFDEAMATEQMIRHAATVARQPDFRATFTATALSLGLPLLGSYPQWRRTLLARVARAALPTLIVWGDADRVLPPAQFHAAVAALPHARSHLFADTGHMPQIERTEQFSDLAADFVRTAAQRT